MIKIGPAKIPAKLFEFLSILPFGSKTTVGRAVAEYLAGIEGGATGGVSHGLAHYPGYKYVSVAQSGGFKSDRQRRYVMAMIREGKINPGYPHRTGEMQRGWRVSGEGARWRINNTAPYAGYVMGDTTQTRMHELQGWRKVSDVLASNISGALRHGVSKLNEWLRSRAK